MLNEEIRSELIRRIELNRLALNDDGFRAVEIQKCKRDIVHFCQNWALTFDPRRYDFKQLPFVLYDFQKELLTSLSSAYEDQRHLVIEKSRDMGATWLIALFGVHRWLFDDNFTCLYSSRKRALVDDRTLDSILGKCRFLIYNLPAFLRPDMDAYIDGKIDADNYLKLINPENRNELVGEATNDNIGRGGRKSIIFLDEFAFVEHSDAIWSSISQTSDCIVIPSTAHGKGNMFYKLRQNKHIETVTLHWKRHPLKDNEWYEKKKLELEPHQLAQEIDIDYTASKAGRVYKRFNKQHHIAENVIYPNPHFEQFITWDFGIADSMTMIWGQITPEDVVEIYACYDNTDQDIEFYLPLVHFERPGPEYWNLLPEIEQKRIDALLKKISVSGLWRFDHYGDFAGTQRGANNRHSIRDRMRMMPYQIDLICTPRADFANRIQCLDNLFKMRQNPNGGLEPRIQLSPDVEPVSDALFNYVWASEDIDNPNIKPKHDWSSHYTSSLEFFAINRYPIIESKPSYVQRIR